MQAGNSGDTALERRTESEWRQARIQAEVLSQVQRRLRKARAAGTTSDVDRCQRSITQLQLESLSMNALFNDFSLVPSLPLNAASRRALCDNRPEGQASRFVSGSSSATAVFGLGAEFQRAAMHPNNSETVQAVRVIDRRCQIRGVRRRRVCTPDRIHATRCRHTC